MWPISVRCRVLEVSLAGYHGHFMRRASAWQRRHLSDDALLVHIQAIDAKTRGGHGWPRTWKELLARGIRVGKDRVQKLMPLHGICAKGKRRFKVMTDIKHDLPIAPNLLDRELAVAEPDKVWAGDISYIATDEGWLFLAVVIGCRTHSAGSRSVGPAGLAMATVADGNRLSIRSRGGWTPRSAVDCATIVIAGIISRHWPLTTQPRSQEVDAQRPVQARRPSRLQAIGNREWAMGNRRWAIGKT
jgi:transposase InsO family protein